MRKSSKQLYLGAEFETYRCGKCTIIEYENCDNVVVKFNSPEAVVKCSVNNLKAGSVLNPFCTTVVGTGYLGVGKFNSKDAAYKTWEKMLKRCYDEKYLNKYVTYKGVTVCEEWLNFQNFAEWCQHQNGFGELDNKGKIFQLDKDILAKETKEYSPETCCFVPQEINILFLSANKDVGCYPRGVRFDTQKNRYVTRLRSVGEKPKLCYYTNLEEALLSYKTNKQVYFKNIAAKWSGRIDVRVHDILMNRL
mgnify:FL=1